MCAGASAISQQNATSTSGSTASTFTEDAAQCLLVIIGATLQGKNELVSLIDSVRECAILHASSPPAPRDVLIHRLCQTEGSTFAFVEEVFEQQIWHRQQGRNSSLSRGVPTVTIGVIFGLIGSYSSSLPGGMSQSVTSRP
jgi:hypothetical protein